MDQTDFSTTITFPGERAVVLARGELDLASAPALEAALAGCLRRSCRSIGVEMWGVTFMDCAGLGAVLACRSRAGAAGRAMWVLRPSARVRRLLALTGTERLLAA